MRAGHPQMRMPLKRSIQDVNCRELFDSLHLSYWMLAVGFVPPLGHCSLTDDGQVASERHRPEWMHSDCGGCVPASLAVVALDVSVVLESDHAVMNPLPVV